MKFKHLFSIALSLMINLKSKSQEINNTEAIGSVLNPVTIVADTNLTSNATLNVFFSNKINTYLSEASDVSTSKAYAVLDNTDGRLFIGGSFNPKESITEFNRCLFTAGAKANVKDGFANIFGSKGINNDIGINLKLSVLGKGSLYYNNDFYKKKLESKRAYLTNKYSEELTRKLAAETVNRGIRLSSTEVVAFLGDESQTTVEEYAKEEATFITTKKLYNLAHSYWITFDAYYPVTKSEYDIVTDLKNTEISTEKYKPWELNIVWSNFWEKTKWIGNPFLLKGTTLLTIKGSIVNNNSVSAEMLDSYSYDTYLTQVTNIDTQFLAKLKTSDVHYGEFKNFVTPKISGRLVYMPVQALGISAAIEKNFGTIDDLNWKLGIPFSLKDNEGKPKVDFEIVWKEVRKSHTIGLSVGLPIGKNIF